MMMKKTRGLRMMVLALLMIGALCACGGGGAGEGPGNDGPSAPDSASPGAVDEVAPVTEEGAPEAPEDGGGVVDTAPKAPPSSNPEKLGGFTTYDIDRNIVTQDILADHDLTMFHVWSTAIDTSVQEMAIIAALDEKYADQGFQTVGIVVDLVSADGSMNAGRVAKARFAIADSGAGYLHILPSQELIDARLNAIELLPVSFFVTADGTFVGEHHIGSRPLEAWEATVEELLAQQ